MVWLCEGPAVCGVRVARWCGMCVPVWGWAVWVLVWVAVGVAFGGCLWVPLWVQLWVPLCEGPRWVPVWVPP